MRRWFRLDPLVRQVMRMNRDLLIGIALLGLALGWYMGMTI